MKEHRFNAGPPYQAKLLFLLLPVLLIVAAGSWHSLRLKQRVEHQLTLESGRLLMHRAEAQKILARQKAFAAQPTKLRPPARGLDGLDVLQQSWQENIALLSVNADPRKKTLRLELAADSLNGLLDFVLRLEQQKAKVELQGHKLDPSLATPWRIRASLTLEYKHVV
ncbi:MAG TPA: hypothetical protein VGH05_05750 [Buttiauxella sp.]|jgi:hypothetical protein